MAHLKKASSGHLLKSSGGHLVNDCGDGCTDCSNCATNCNDNESITLDISIVSYDGTECDCASSANGTLAKNPSYDCRWGDYQVGSSQWAALVWCREISGVYTWHVSLEHECGGANVGDCYVYDIFELCDVDCSDGHPTGGPWRLEFDYTGYVHNLIVDLTIT
jgi:hypothetical protein